MNNKHFETRLKEDQKLAESVLESYRLSADGYTSTIKDAVNYSIFAGGKRLRPVMMLETFRMFSNNEKIVYPFMAAIEMIHTYSLVHDDLPAMDNDMYRRGKKTTHAVYGEAVGILTGDALLNRAFEIMSSAAIEMRECRSAVKAMLIIATHAGIEGMIGGQTLDIETEGKEIDLETLNYIHENKTARLIQAAIMAGAVLGLASSEYEHRDISAQKDTENSASNLRKNSCTEDRYTHQEGRNSALYYGLSEEEILKLLEKTGFNLGMAFQIMDDILDVAGDEESIGKPVGSDAENNKTTYVTLKGMDCSRMMVKKYSDEAIMELEKIGGGSAFMTELIASLIYRNK